MLNTNDHRSYAVDGEMIESRAEAAEEWRAEGISLIAWW